MIYLFLQAVARFVRLFLLSLWPPRSSAARRSLRRVVLMLVFLPLLALVQLAHWLGFLCDEVFFRGYRRVPVSQPVFVSGVPRSGTTFLHRVLAVDSQFTTFSTWECLFAPSVTERRLVRALAYLDRLVGGPVARLLGWIERRIFTALDDVHEISLTDAEEDYFVFTPVLCCFILVVPFPYAQWIWDMGRFDSAVAPSQQQRLADYYFRCVQKHLYVHGTDKCFLSKNATFMPIMPVLLRRMPDARVIMCVRTPHEVVASQLSSLRDGMEFFCNHAGNTGFRDRIISLLHHYYRLLIDFSSLPGSHATVPMTMLKNDLESVVEKLYREFGLEKSADFAQQLARISEAAADYRSAHSYDLAQFDLNIATIDESFADVYRDLPVVRPDEQEQAV